MSVDGEREQPAHKRPRAPELRVLALLLVLALASRLVWTLVVHPPGDFVFKDMNAYVTYARRLLEHGLSPDRGLAFQAWGTHTLLALPLAVFGPDALVAAGVLWAVLGAAAVVFTYLLACRVTASPRLAAGVGVAALLWYPNLAYSGLFLSETPFLCFLTALVWRLVVLVQDGRGAPGCGLLAAICFALRPEVAVFLALAFGLWLLVRTKHAAAGWRHVATIAAPLALVVLFSLWHFHRHTGRWGGVAESARANLTPARCHHPWIQAFERPSQLAGRPDLNAGKIYGVVYFYGLLERGDGGPFALRPAFGTTPAALEIAAGDGSMPLQVGQKGISLQFVGHRADPAIHAAIQRACIERTGIVEQLRYSVVNLAGLWFFNHQWPDNTRNGGPFQPWSDRFIKVFQWGVWVPSLVGMGRALRRARHEPGLALCALALLSSMIVAAFWFGEIRLRTPYDPLALLLAAQTYWSVAAWARSARHGESQRTGSGPGARSRGRAES